MDTTIIEYLLIVSVVLNIFFWFGGTEAFKQPFNPETDICTEWKLEINNKNYIYDGIKDCSDRNDGFIWCLTSSDTAHKYPNMPIQEDSKIIECSDWRPKTVCELNPNNSTACFCDEYEEMLGLNVTYWVTDITGHFATKTYHYSKTAINLQSPVHYKYPSDAPFNKGAIDLDSFPVAFKIFNSTGKCIKAHEKAETIAKDNEAQTYDCSTIDEDACQTIFFNCDNTSQKYTITDVC